MKPKLAVLVVAFVLSSSLAPSFVTNVRAPSPPCTPACLEADANIPPAEASVTVRVDNSTFYTLNQTLVFPFNTTHTIQLMNTTVNVPSLGTRFIFRQWNWVHNGYPIQWSTTVNMTTPRTVANYTSSTNGPFMAQFDEQFALTLTFTDPSGQPVNPPSSVVLANGQTTVRLTSYTNQWLTAGIWTVADATWEGGSQAVLGTPTIDLTQAGSTKTVALKAYPATLHIIDSQSKPVVGATVTVTFGVNGTTKSFTTDSQGTIQLGRIPLGSYVAHIVYQGRDFQSYSVDASLNPTDTIKLSTSGQTSQSIDSSIVAVAIFGVALFLVVLAFRLRKSPLPPGIDSTRD